jgi:hypothetical protein
MANPTKTMTMTVEHYTPERHHATLCKWLSFYDMEPIEAAHLPPTGFVVEGLAMGFLYKSDSKAAQIETLISNGYAPREARDAATDLVVEAIIAEARASGFLVLLGITSLDAVVQRALKHGFALDEKPYRIVSLEL